MPDDNNTAGDTTGYTGMGAACGVCGAWIQEGQTHVCIRPIHPPDLNPFPPPPTYAQPVTFPQWIDPSVLERIATSLEKIATEKLLKELIDEMNLDGEGEIAAAFRLHMMRFWSYEKIKDFCLGFLSEEDKRDVEK